MKGQNALLMKYQKCGVKVLPDFTSQGLYPKETIARLFNLSERRIEQLVQKKVIPKAGRGLFDLASTVQAYILYLQGLCSGAIKSGEASELDIRLLEAKLLERESKARQAKCRADAMEQKLHDNKLRSEIEKIPEKLSQRLSGSIFDRAFIETAAHETRKLIDETFSGG